jgi:acyl carrier protein
MEFETFAALVRRVLNRPGLTLTPDMRATQVPGWDSLQHVVILMEVEAATGVEIDPSETLKVPDLGALLQLISAREQAA